MIDIESIVETIKNELEGKRIPAFVSYETNGYGKTVVLIDIENGNERRDHHKAKSIAKKIIGKDNIKQYFEDVVDESNTERYSAIHKFVLI